LIGKESAYYCEPLGESSFNLDLIEKIDRIYTAYPFMRSRRIILELKKFGIHANRKRVSRLMDLMGIEAIYPKPRLSINRENHRRFPYLLEDLAMERPCQVWSTDIAYIPMHGGNMYLAATMDWYSRLIVSWRVSDSLEVSFCLDSLEEVLSRSKPEIFNTDQKPQFTSET
jgi:putative transposase